MLGKTLRRWSIRMAGRDNLNVELDEVTVSDLLAGELPKPFILLCQRQGPFEVVEPHA
jgi:hypothetical protein